MSLYPFSPPSQRWLVGLAIAATVLTGSTAFYALSQSNPRPVTGTASPSPVPRKVAALGRLEPEAEVIKLSAPLALDGDRVAQLLVKEGDRVKAGQVIAVLDSHNRLSNAVSEAEQAVQVAKAKLGQVQAGAKSGEIQAQQATIRRLEAELSGETATQAAEIARWQSEVRTAQAEFDRFQQLYQQGAIATSTLDNKRLAFETAQAQFNQAQAKQNQSVRSIQAQIQQAKSTLAQIAEVRPVDVKTAQTEVDAAIAALERAKTDRQQAEIRAPQAGQILKIHAHPGEKLGDAGIADLAQTNQMVAVAEVYQSDIGKVQIGQAAVVTSPAFAGELHGTVSQIGLQVSRQNVFSNEPGENLDRRVVEVKIRLQPTDSQKVAGLTDLQVQTVIAIDQTSQAKHPTQRNDLEAACPNLWITNDRFSFNQPC